MSSDIFNFSKHFCGMQGCKVNGKIKSRYRQIILNRNIQNLLITKGKFK